MRKKLKSRGGFTLTEMLVVLGIMSLLAVAMGSAVPVAARLYQETTAIAEANTLLSTVTLALSDELHYADDVRETEDGVRFLSRRFGADVTVATEEGRVTVGGQEILSDKTYTGGLEAAVTLGFDGAVFDVNLVISKNGAQLTEGSFQIRPLNS